MKQYLDLLDRVLTNGKIKHNRTGIDTISISGAMLEFDMSTGKFPLLTTKKMGLKTIFSELEMFIKGITSKKFLQDRKSGIWNAWCNPQKVPYSTDPEQQKLMATEDDLGPIYGFNGNYWEMNETTKPEKRMKTAPFYYKSDPQLIMNVGEIGDSTATEEFISVYSKPLYEKVYTIWESILERCYDEASDLFADYGARGFFVFPRWHILSCFLKDITRIPGWHQFMREPDRYVLSENYYITNCYSDTTTAWISKEDDFMYMTQPGIPRKKLPINQLKAVIDTLKTDPTSRRMIVSYWNPSLMSQMALPPCHYCYEFLSDGESVDLLFNMRSVDCFLGMPFDIAHYAMLLLLICKQVNMKPGKLIGFFADTHIYTNHLDQVKEQLSREPFESPTVNILNAEDPNWTIWDWKYTDFTLDNYNCYPAIKAPVAV